MRRILLPAGTLLTVAVLAATPLRAQSGGNLFDNIFKPPAPVQQADPVADAQSELVVRVERLENQLRQLTGQIEQLQFRNQQLENQLRGQQDGGPARTAPVGGPQAGAGGAPGLSPVPIVPRAPGAATAGRRNDAFDPSETSAAPGAPQPLGSPASSSAGLVRPPVGPTDLAPGAVPGSMGAVASGTPSGTSKELFDAGYGAIQRQDYAGAEQTLRQFLQTYPSDRLIPEATYFLGESLFQRQDYKDAAENFLQVSTKFPNAPRAPEALLRLGQSLAGLNEREAACATLGEVDRRYPRASSTVRQAVEREQKRAGC